MRLSEIHDETHDEIHETQGEIYEIQYETKEVLYTRGEPRRD